MGSIPTADTLYAMDEPIQTDTEDWAGLAPMARLLSAGDVLVEYDQAYEHYGTPQPQLLAQALASHPAGALGPGRLRHPGPQRLVHPHPRRAGPGRPGDPPWPSPLVTYTVTDPRPDHPGRVRRGGPGGGRRRHRAAGPGRRRAARHQQRHLLRRHPRHPPRPAGQLWNRPGPRWWSPTPTASRPSARTPSRPTPARPRPPAEDPAATTPSDYPIDLFPGAPADAKSVATYTGAVDVTASSYGNSVSYYPEDRALQRHRRRPRHRLGDRDLRAQPVGPVVAGPAPGPGHRRPGHPHPAGHRRPEPLDHPGHPAPSTAASPSPSTLGRLAHGVRARS